MGFIANQRDILITGIVLTSASMLAVGARFYARWRLKAKRGPDDWFALAAGTVFLADNVGMIWSVCNDYYGIDPLEMSPHQLEMALKLSFAGIFLMSTILTLARFSVLFLYNRLFGVYATFRTILIATGALSVAWMITVWFACIFRCNPIKGAWDLTIPSRCINLETIFVICESLNAVLDVFLVCLPVSKLQIIQLPTKDKIGLAIVFLTGGFVGLTSVFRITFTYNPSKMGAVIDSIFWLWVQLAIAIICACLPTLRTLLPSKKIFTPPSSIVKQLLGLRMTKSTTHNSRSKATGQRSVVLAKPLYIRYGIPTKSDDEIALTGVSVGIK